MPHPQNGIGAECAAGTTGAGSSEPTTGGRLAASEQAGVPSEPSASTSKVAHATSGAGKAYGMRAVAATGHRRRAEARAQPPVAGPSSDESARVGQSVPL